MTTGRYRHDEFLSKPTIITEPGKYLTRAGQTVFIDRIMPYGPYAALGRYLPNNISETWDISGRTEPYNESPNDIVSKA